MAQDLMQRLSNDPLINAIRIYVEWYRQRWQIRVGSQHVGGDSLGASEELVEQLARAEFGSSPWPELLEPGTRIEILTWVARRVDYWRGRDTQIEAWGALPQWQVSPLMLEMLKYIWAFRYYHGVDFEHPRAFRYDDLGVLGELLLGKLVNTPEFQGAWTQFEDPEFLARAVVFAHDVCWPRLEVYRVRKQLPELPVFAMSMALVALQRSRV